MHMLYLLLLDIQFIALNIYHCYIYIYIYINYKLNLLYIYIYIYIYITNLVYLKKGIYLLIYLLSNETY